MMHLQTPVPPTSGPPPPTTMNIIPTPSVAPLSQRFGDMPVIEDDPGIAALEREAVTKPRSLAVDSTKLFQPSKPHSAVGPKQEPQTSGLFGPSRFEGPSTSHPPPRFEIHADPRVMHSLQLSQYLRKMNALMAEASETDKSSDSIGVKRKLSANSSSPPAKVPALPPLPATLMAKVAVKKEISLPPFHPPPDEATLSPFAEGRWADSMSIPPSLSNAICRQLARKSVITLIAHAGFDNAAESVVDVLTDLLQSFLRQLTGNLADARDAKMTSGGSNFPDILEQVFTEMGVGTTKSLLRFYDSDAIRRHETLKCQAEAVTSQYRAMTSDEPEGLVKTETNTGDSKSWFAGAGSGIGHSAAEVKFDSTSVVKRETDIKDAKVPLASHSIAPGQMTTSDTTDYDADDDDVITEPSSVKSIFENEAGNSAGDATDSGYDLVASTLISLSSPPKSNKDVKKKKKP